MATTVELQKLAAMREWHAAQVILIESIIGTSTDNCFPPQTSGPSHGARKRKQKTLWSEPETRQMTAWDISVAAAVAAGVEFLS